MGTSEIIERMDKLHEKLENDDYNYRTYDWSRGFRKGYIEAIKTIKVMLESQEIQQSFTIVTASTIPDSIKEVDNHEERNESSSSQPRRYAVRA